MKKITIVIEDTDDQESASGGYSAGGASLTPDPSQSTTTFDASDIALFYPDECDDLLNGGTLSVTLESSERGLSVDEAIFHHESVRSLITSTILDTMSMEPRGVAMKIIRALDESGYEVVPKKKPVNSSHQ